MIFQTGSETVGLIGAGVGTTGQTGANIGQGLKSLIARQTRPDVQQSLRDFGVEPTVRGGEDLKGFSDILKDLFVQYQRLSEAERRSMLYNVAGAHQASRLAALLDGYVRSQTLAISAQLNLNSAERENARIVETMRAQLAGLATEWTRFATTQADNGPKQALSGITEAMTNLLRLANTDAGSWISTAFLGLLTVTAAKLALVGVTSQQAAGKAGILRNSLTAVGGAMSDLRGLLTQIVTSSTLFARVPATAVASWGALRLTLAGVAASLASLGPWIAAIAAGTWAFNAAAEALGLSSDKAQDKFTALEKRAQAATAAVEASARALRLLDTTDKALANIGTPTGRANLLAQVSEIAFPSDERTSDEERAKNESKARGLAAEFAAMARNNDQAGIANRLEEVRAQWIERQARNRQRSYELLRQEDTALRREIERLEKSPLGSERRIAELKQQRAGLTDKRAGMVLEDFESNERDVEAFLGADRQHTAFLEKQKAVVQGIRDIMQQLPGESPLDKYAKEIAALETIRAYHQQHLSLLKEKQKAAEQSGQGRTVDELDMLIRGRREGIALRREKLAEQIRAMPADQRFAVQLDEMARMIAEEGSNPDVLRIGKIGSAPIVPAAPILEQSPVARPHLLQAARELERIREQELAVNALERERATEFRTGRSLRLRGEVEEAQKGFDEADAKLKGIDNAEVRSQIEAQERRGVSILLARAETSSFLRGETEGEALIAQRQTLGTSTPDTLREADRIGKLSEILRLSGDIGRASAFAAEADARRVAALVQLVAMSDNLLRSQERIHEISREEENLQIRLSRELQKRTLLQGPGELLRNLAVDQLSRSGGLNNAGGFFALDTSSRQDFLARPENSDELRRLRQERDALLAANRNFFGTERPSSSQLAEKFGNAAAARQSLFGQFAQDQNQINASARLALSLTGAADSARAFAQELNTVRAAMSDLRTRVESLFQTRSGPPAHANAPDQRRRL